VQIFSGHFVDVKAFYTFEFNVIPCITFIGDMDITKAFAFVKDSCNPDIISTYQHSYFNYDDKNVYFNNTIVVLNNKRMIEIADNYCQLLHTINQYSWARQLVNDLAQFKMERHVPAFRRTQIVGFAKEAEMN
jgi:hypothetical protein